MGPVVLPENGHGQNGYDHGAIMSRRGIMAIRARLSRTASNTTTRSASLTGRDTANGTIPRTASYPGFFDFNQSGERPER